MYVTFPAEGYYSHLSLSCRDFKTLSRLGVKHAKNYPRNVKDKVLTCNQTATTPSAKIARQRHEKLDYARHHEMATASGNVEI